MEEKPKNLWNKFNANYQIHVTISTVGSITESKEVDERIIYMEDLEKRKKAYGICGECNEPEGGFGKIYSADWPEGHIRSWNIKNQKWNRCKTCRCALKSLNDNSSDIVSSDFLNEIKNHLQICLANIVQCFGITRNPNTNEYMMVLEYCEAGNLRNYLIKSKEYIDYTLRISKLRKIAGGLLDIHSAGKVHKDFHSEIPYSDIPHNEFLAIQICKGHRPKISEDVPKLLADLIMKCWDAEIKNRPTTKELYLILKKWYYEIKNIEGNGNNSDGDSDDSDSEIIKSDKNISAQLSELELNEFWQK
ncbi:kinase-like domain-containing protein [Rhizophagus clarus]|uniref:Kinase-like domain-containing protein n=1 Tax=Rhizophagus clarus TaxID=94130 RepID=A0A8H3QQ82_9GLOM|nr:kinase-like domain-containing protein [Rhizophagus clarus]